MSDDRNQRKALKKADVKAMIAVIQKRGYHVYKTLTHFHVWTKRGKDGEYVGGFIWEPRRRAWRFQAPRMYLHTVADFKEAVTELVEDRTAVLEVERAWEQYRASRTERNWMEYVGAVAATYMRTWEPEDGDGPV